MKSEVTAKCQTPVCTFSYQPHSRIFPALLVNFTLNRYNCDCVLGYSETVSYSSGVCIMSAPSPCYPYRSCIKLSFCNRFCSLYHSLFDSLQVSGWHCCAPDVEGLRRHSTGRPQRSRRLALRPVLWHFLQHVLHTAGQPRSSFFFSLAVSGIHGSGSLMGGSAGDRPAPKETCPAAMIHIPYKFVLLCVFCVIAHSLAPQNIRHHRQVLAMPVLSPQIHTRSCPCVLRAPPQPAVSARTLTWPSSSCHSSTQICSAATGI
jgi:hypothetical protein